jgi:hypothetical protein
LRKPIKELNHFLRKVLWNYLKRVKLLCQQVKADGTYRNAIIRSGEVELISRQGEVSTLTGAKSWREWFTVTECGELTIDGVKRLLQNGWWLIHHGLLSYERGEARLLRKYQHLRRKWPNGWCSKWRYTVWDMITVDEYFEASDTEYR